MPYSYNIKPVLLLSLHLTLTFFLEAKTSSDSVTDEELREMLFGEATSGILKPKARWVPSSTIELGVGYSDNPLYAPFVREDTAYVEVSSEVFLMREGNTEYFTYFYLFGEGKRFETFSDNKEAALLLGQFEHAYTPKDSSHSYGFRFRHTYYDQGFDFSELGLPYRMSVSSNKTEWIPYLSHRFSPQTTGIISLSKGFENYRKITDDNRDRKLSITLQGNGLLGAWKLFGEIDKKKYKERQRRNGDGSLISAIPVETLKKSVSFKIVKAFKPVSLGDSTAKLQWSWLKDGAGGYYDYKKIGLSLEQEFKLSPYTVTASLSGTDTKYDTRKIDTNKIFERQSLKYSTSITRILGEKTKVYLKWSREEDFSNARDYEYYSNFWSLGLTWEI